ncbi:MAG: hypothetical protein ABFC98_03675 [Candidatus Cloacimonas sp.]
MKTRFILILLIIFILFSAWLYLSYSLGISEKDKLEKLANLPIYAYVADTTKVAPLLSELKPVPGIKNVVYETPQQAATELIQAYGLPITPQMVQDYTLPAVITINLLSNRESISSKSMILDILRSHLPEADIDSQSNAYGSIIEELQRQDLYSLVFNLVMGFLIMLVLVFSRATWELHKLLHYKGHKHSALENVRLQRQSVQHTWLMLIIPLPLCLLIYFALIYFNSLPQLIPYWVFIIQAGSAILGTLINYFILHSFEHQLILAENPVEIVSPVNKINTQSTENNNDTPTA